MEDIIWRPVVGYEGLYEISSYGRIKSLERYRSNNGGIQLIKEKIMKPLDYNGYKNVITNRREKSNNSKGAQKGHEPHSLKNKLEEYKKRLTLLK